jgi:hypothetical protein
VVVAPWVSYPPWVSQNHWARSTQLATVDHFNKFETLRGNLRALNKPSPIRPPDGPRPPRVGEFRTVLVRFRADFSGRLDVVGR